jgi:hypothetical protein
LLFLFSALIDSLMVLVIFTHTEWNSSCLIFLFQNFAARVQDCVQSWILTVRRAEEFSSCCSWRTLLFTEVSFSCTARILFWLETCSKTVRSFVNLRWNFADTLLHKVSTVKLQIMKTNGTVVLFYAVLEYLKDKFS